MRLLGLVLIAGTFRETSYSIHRYGLRESLLLLTVLHTSFVDMKLLLPATALSVPILAHSHLSRGYQPTNLQRSQAAIAVYIFNRLFFQRNLGVSYHQLHVSDPLQLLNDATDFYEILKHHVHYSNAGHRTIVPPNLQF